MADLPPPIFDPSEYPGYLDAQRKQQVASILMNAWQNAVNAPTPTAQPVGPYAVQPKRGLAMAIAPLASALLAGKAMNASNDAQRKYMTGFYAPDASATGTPPAAAAPVPAATGPGSGILRADAPPDEQAAAEAVTNGTAAPPAPSAAPGAPASAALIGAPHNPMIPAGMGPHQAQALYNLMGPQKYAETFIAPNYKQPEIVAQMRSAGIDPQSPEGQAYQRNALALAQSTEVDKSLRAANIDPQSPFGIQYKQALLAKSAQNIQEVKAGNTIVDMAGGVPRPLYTGPIGTIGTRYDAAGNPTQYTIPGGPAAVTDESRAKTSGSVLATPLKVGVDNSGADVYEYPSGGYGTSPTAPPGGYQAPRTATSATTTASPGDIESQKTGAQAGRAFESDLNKQSKGAVEILKSTSELRNLAQQAGGVSVSNDARARIGALFMAAGVDPQTVQKITGVDAGAIQAAEKQTASLAKASVHEISSRGTNLDLATFLKNNPNLNMNDPAAFQRTIDFIENGARSTIDEHAAFADYKKTQPKAENWETEFNSLWNKKQLADIEAGKTNSPRPASGPTPRTYTLQELQDEAARRGLKPPVSPPGATH